MKIEADIAAQLTGCPFCGAGETQVQLGQVWTGMKYSTHSYKIRHWCAKPSRTYIEFTHRTPEELVGEWNRRAT